MENYFKNKKITVVGLGLLGGALNDICYLAEQGAEIIVTDLKSRAELTPSLEKLREFGNITFILGEHRLEDFKNVDLILEPGNVPKDSIYLAEAQKHNIPIYVSESLFAKYAKGVTLVGVTGTRGKSTVTHLISHTLRERRKHVLLGGNVRNVSTVALLKEIKAGDIVVLELDSWALHRMGEIERSPNIGVFTNFMPDHMDYYGGDMQKYFDDKANIFKFQKNGDVLITGREVTDTWIQNVKPPISPKVPKPIPQDWNLKIIGEHNRENAALAAEALRALSLTEEQIQSGFESFEGVPGRLQFVREVDGIKIYNDNNATTPDATIAALRALGKDENIVLIMGGADKGLPLSALLSEIPKYCKTTLLLPGTGTNRLLQNSSVNRTIFEEVDSLQKAVNVAQEKASIGDAILFSPAFASFGQFKNEYDRNDQFVNIVHSL